MLRFATVVFFVIVVAAVAIATALTTVATVGTRIDVLYFERKRACILLFCCDSYGFAMLCRLCCWTDGRMVAWFVWMMLFMMLVVLLVFYTYTTYLQTHVYFVFFTPYVSSNLFIVMCTRAAACCPWQHV